MMRFGGQDRGFRREGDRKPEMFVVGDMFLYANGETAIVTEVFDEYRGQSRYGPQWTLRLKWFSGRDGDKTNQRRDGNEIHGVLRTNMFNQLSYRSGPWLIPVKK